MYHLPYVDGFSLPRGNETQLLACRCCLATDTRLYTLSGALTESYKCLVGSSISTNLIRSIDRVAHKLVLEFTLGLDAKVINISHDYHDDVYSDKCTIQYDDPNKITIGVGDPNKIIIDMDDTDGLTDVLNDFEEIRNSLNEVDDNIGFNDSEFNDISHGNFEGSSFNEHVDRLLSGKEMTSDLDDLVKKTDYNVKNINNGVKDIMSTGFKGKNALAVKKSLEDGKNLIAAKQILHEETSNTFNDAEDFLNANINDSLPEVINFNDVSINTTDLNDNDNSNLVETFNNFILDHDYLDEKFLIETGDTEGTKKKVIAKKTDENAQKAAVPKIKKRDKLQLMKEIENKHTKRKIPMKPRKKILSETVETGAKRPKKKLESFKTKYEEESNSKIVSKNGIPNDVKKDFIHDFVKFGDQFNFRIFVLTIEEQLEELEKKREGVLYLGAPYKCELCAKGFRSEVTHKNHLKVHQISHGLFECAICRSRHKTEARRRRHADIHRLKYCCTQCEFVARSREKAESHYEWHAGKTYACQYCGEIFGKASTQLSHTRLNHPGACAACELCGESFVGAYGLRLHTRRMHAPADNSTELVELYCFTCRMQFKNQDAFRRHKAVSGRTCFPDARPCAECGENFETDASLLQHRRLRHAEAPLRCQMCDATFTNVVSRQTHFERVHLNVRPPRRDGAVRVKSAPRHNLTKKKVMCELCGNKYHSAAALRYHQRSHSGERPFACPRCPKAFAFGYSLQAHVRTHTGERPHRCSQCARAFPNANNLARHRKIVHLGQKHYSRCAICLKWLTSPSAMKLHVATVHNDMPWPRKRQ